MDNRLIMLWLSTITGLGTRRVNALLEFFGDANALWLADYEELASVPGIPAQLAKEIIEERDEQKITEQAEKLAQNGISFAALGSPEYPPLLSLIHDPPAVLYYIGELPADALTVAVIGSRRCSQYGVSVARTLARDLAARGVVIVSGMAKGIDAWGHKGALEGGGKTIAVLGSGVDICYPAENGRLYTEIIKNGCVLSEYPPGTPPLAGYFPARNRLISGLSKAVVVVEACEKSGTLITVDMALEQGREVLAVPGNITSKLSSGTNALIKQGAHALVTDYKDVFNVLGIEEKADNHLKKDKLADNFLAEDEKLIYDTLCFSPISVEEISMSLKMPVTAVVNICTMLEIKGLAKKLPGLRYVKD